jgi:hypothetical protein
MLEDVVDDSSWWTFSVAFGITGYRMQQKKVNPGSPVSSM